MDPDKDRGYIPLMVGQEANTGTTISMDDQGRARLERLAEESPAESSGSVPGAPLTGRSSVSRGGGDDYEKRLRKAAQNQMRANAAVGVAGEVAKGLSGGGGARSKPPAWLRQYMSEQELSGKGDQIAAEMTQALSGPIATAGTAARQAASERQQRNEFMKTNSKEGMTPEETAQYEAWLRRGR
jgi:hypothetical protein